jgi:hypothetical protein
MVSLLLRSRKRDCVGAIGNGVNPGLKGSGVFPGVEPVAHGLRELGLGEGLFQDGASCLTVTPSVVLQSSRPSRGGIALRCCKLSGRFEDFWQRRSTAATGTAA